MLAFGKVDTGLNVTWLSVLALALILDWLAFAPKFKLPMLVLVVAYCNEEF